MSIPLSTLGETQCFQNSNYSSALDDNHDDLEEDDVKQTMKECPQVSTSAESVIAYLPGFSVWHILSRVWKVVSLLLNFVLICTAFYLSYMLFKAINCEDEDVQCYEDTEWVVSWTDWLHEAIMPE
ncbi:unnamed protein product [Orchesella dallaii]|uniref:Uncharacterized protein n=1 Tax=Orchesella dallaii TaxID=48710 RepID=A0ABP1QTX7_9HEXA